MRVGCFGMLELASICVGVGLFLTSRSARVFPQPGTFLDTHTCCAFPVL
jgi:hypothetical protein